MKTLPILLVSLCAVLPAPLALAETSPSAIFPAAAGKPHTYVIAVEGKGVPLGQSELVEVRDSFVAWAASSGWKLAAKNGPSTAVVHLSIGAPNAAAQNPSRAFVWSDRAQIEGGGTVVLPEMRAPGKSNPQVTSYGGWSFAMSDAYHPIPLVNYH